MSECRNEDLILREYSNLSGCIGNERQKLLACQNQQRELSDYIKSLEPRKCVFEGSAVIIDRIHREQKLSAEVEVLDKGIDVLTNNLSKSESDYQRKLESLADARKKRELTDKELVALEEQLKQCDLQSLYKKQSDTKNRKAMIERLVERVVALKSEEEKCIAELESLKKKSEEIAVLSHDIAVYRATVEADAESETLLRNTYESVRRQGEQWVTECRHNLHTGDVCPLCLQRIENEIPSDEEIYLRNIRPVEEAWRKAEKKLSDSHRTLAEAEASCRVMTEAYSLMDAAHAQAKHALESDRNRLQCDLLNFGVDRIDGSIEFMRSKLPECEKQLGELDLQIEGARKLVADVDVLRQRLRQEDVEIKAAEELVDISCGAITRIRSKIES
ncbi:MAG: hypothetical protein K2L80_06985, partial [Muribaculaceae bacterium]|nr:hypothetical protein [Muribaculaceae bacterium]